MQVASSTFHPFLEDAGSQLSDNQFVNENPQRLEPRIFSKWLIIIVLSTIPMMVVEYRQTYIRRHIWPEVQVLEYQHITLTSGGACFRCRPLLYSAENQLLV